MKNISIIVLVALALALVPTAQAQETCRAYTAHNSAGTQLVLEANNAEGGCEAFLPGQGLRYKSATLEVTQRPGSHRIHALIHLRAAKDVSVEKTLSAPPTATDTDNILLHSTWNVWLRIVLYDVSGPFSAKLTIQLETPMPTATPTATIPPTGACESGDFYCSYSGRGYSQTLTDLRIGGSSAGGSQLEDYVVSSHLAEPGAWRVKAWGCGSMSGSNRGLFLTIRAQADGLADTDLINSISLGSEELATMGFIYHVPIPANRELGDTDRRLVIRLNTGSGWPAEEWKECSFSFTKLENNNYNAASGTLTIYQGRQAWGGIPKYYIFPSAASAATVNISWSFDADWITTLPHGSPGTFCRSDPGAQTTLNAGNPNRTLALTAGAEFFCGGINENRQAKISITVSAYVVGPTNTPTPSRTATITPTASSTRTLQPAYTATNTRTATVSPTASSTTTPSLTVTGTRPIEAPCALNNTYEVPVAPGTVDIELIVNIRFVVADNPIFINVGSQAMEIQPGSYTWERQTATYTLYSLTQTARILICAGSAASPTLTLFVPTETAIDDVCIPADKPPIGGGNQVFPDLSIPVPTWRAIATIEITITSFITESVVITTVSTLRAGLSTPQASIKTMSAPYSAEAGAAFAATAVTNMQPALNWLAVLNPQSWQTSNNALWAIAPIVGPVIPLGIIWISSIVIRFIIWCVRWIIRIIELIPGM